MKFLTSLGYVASLCLSILLVIGVYKETHSFSLTFALALLFAIVRPWRLDNWLDVWIDAHRVMDQHKAPLRSNSAFKPYGMIPPGTEVQMPNKVYRLPDDFSPARMHPITTAELERLKQRAADLQLLSDFRELQNFLKPKEETKLANPKKEA